MLGNPTQLKLLLASLIFSFSIESFASSLVQKVADQYLNHITWEEVQANGDTDIIRLANIDKIPSEVIAELELLDLFVNFEFPKFWNSKSPLGIADPQDIMEIFDESGIAGYAINVTECNTEECFGWEALYLDKNGTTVKNTFLK
ncbi:MAG: hypothetical protein K2Q26_04535 [Bdellovibrionales bacterium]|nr:hypothetical protein [Bdellovibrionales bacterium]